MATPISTTYLPTWHTQVLTPPRGHHPATWTLVLPTATWHTQVRTQRKQMVVLEGDVESQQAAFREILRENGAEAAVAVRVLATELRAEEERTDTRV